MTRATPGPIIIAIVLVAWIALVSYADALPAWRRQVPSGQGKADQAAGITSRRQARGHRLLAGKIDKSKLGFGERALLLALHVPEGDFPDWAEIAEWAMMVAGAIGGEGSSGVR